MADNETRPAISLEYLAVDVEADADVTGDPVEMALVTSGSPGDDDWIEAEWVGDATQFTDSAGSPRYRQRVRILVGPGNDAAFTPSVASYFVWWNLTDNPEIPARAAGYIRFT